VAGNAVEKKAPTSSSYQPLVVVAAVVSLGVVLDRYLPVRWTFWWFLAAGLWCVWLAAWRARRQGVAGVAMLVCLAAAGAAWHQACWSLFASDDLGALAAESAQPMCVEAVALRGPRRVPAPEFDPLRPVATSDRTRLKLRITGVRDAETWQPASGIATLDVAGHLLGVEAGDRLQVFAQLRAPQGPLNPGEFDFAENLRADRQLCRLSADHPECVTRIAHGSWWRPARWLDRARRAGDNALWTSVGRGQSGLALALVLGEREELDAESTRHFYETGTVHLLSISGLHVGLLALVLFRGLELGFWRRGPALAAVAVITTLYALVIDAEPPAVRATVMVWLVSSLLPVKYGTLAPVV
jgi:competence protein ComEC